MDAKQNCGEFERHPGPDKLWKEIRLQKTFYKTFKCGHTGQYTCKGGFAYVSNKKNLDNISDSKTVGRIQIRKNP